MQSKWQSKLGDAVGSSLPHLVLLYIIELVLNIAEILLAGRSVFFYHCLSFNLRFLITPFVSSNFSDNHKM